MPSRILRGSEYTLDQVLSGDEEDLGIDTIIKTKINNILPIIFKNFTNIKTSLFTFSVSII